MTDIPQWTISDLLARYELEPTLKDVFVEGKFDADVLAQSFRVAQADDRIVYEVDLVDIPSSLLTEHGLLPGNKGRVIALAHELSRIKSECSYRCLVDRDLDHWFGPLERVTRLVWTEYCSIELYFFHTDILYDLLITTAKARIDDWDAFMQSIELALRAMYILRLADRSLAWSLDWITPDRCLRVREGRLEFDQSDYVTRLLMKNRRIAFRADFVREVANWQHKAVADPRNAIRGHDLLMVLAWVVDKFRGIKHFANELSLGRLFVLMGGRVPQLVALLD